MIKAAMRFVNSDRQYSPRVPKTDVRYDKMWKVRHLLDHFNEKCRALLSPGQFISADEMMILATCKYFICAVFLFPGSHVCVCSPLFFVVQRPLASRFG